MVNSAADCCLRGEDLGAFSARYRGAPAKSRGLCASVKAALLIFVQLDRDLEPIAFTHGTVLVHEVKNTHIRKVNLFLVSFLSAFKNWDFFFLLRFSLYKSS